MDRLQSEHVSALARVEFAASTPDSSARWAGRWLQGDSPAMARLARQVEAISAAGFAGLLIQGAPGTGKRELAQRLHGASSRASRPLASVDASDDAFVEPLRALTADVHEADAANSSAWGSLLVESLERASDTMLQALLELAVASETSVCGCGLLLLSAASLEALRRRSMTMGQLLGRAATTILKLPALSERPEDIPLLARAQAERIASLHGLSASRLSEQAIGRLLRHDFRGNCRELDAIVELAALRAAGDWITDTDLGLAEAVDETSGATAEVVIRMPGSSLRDIELQAIRVSLQVTGGRLVRAAELLGITRHALRRKLEKYGLSDLRARTPQDAPTELLEEDSYI